jgi:hypothetical protein
MCQEWADESVPVRPRSARARPEGGPMPRTARRIFVTTPASPRPDVHVMEEVPGPTRELAHGAVRHERDPPADLRCLSCVSQSFCPMSESIIHCLFLNL